MKHNLLIFIFFFHLLVIAQKNEKIVFNPTLNPSLQIMNRIGVGIGSLGVLLNQGNSLFSKQGISYNEFLGSVDIVLGKTIFVSPNIAFQVMNIDFIQINKKSFVLNTSIALGNLNYLDFKRTVDGRIYFEIDFGSWFMIGYRFAQFTYGTRYHEIGQHALILRYYLPLFLLKNEKKGY